MSKQEQLIKAQGLISNAIRYIKKQCPEGYGKIIKKAIEDGDVGEEVKLTLKRRRCVSPHDDERGEKVAKRDEVIEIEEEQEEEVNEERNEANVVDNQKEDLWECSFIDFADDIRSMIKNMKLQDDSTISKPSVVRKDMSLDEMSKSCILCQSYTGKYTTHTSVILILFCYVLFQKCESLPPKEIQKVFNAFETKSKHTLYKMRHVGSFLHVVKNKFSPKFAILVALSLGYNKLKRMTVDKVSQLILLIVANENHSIFEEVSKFNVPQKVKVIFDAFGYE